MTTNQYNELVLTKDEYTALKAILAEFGVSLNWSSSDGTTYSCYVRNAYKEVIGLWGSDLEKKLALEFFERYAK